VLLVSAHDLLELPLLLECFAFQLLLLAQVFFQSVDVRNQTLVFKVSLLVLLFESLDTVHRASKVAHIDLLRRYFLLFLLSFVQQCATLD